MQHRRQSSCASFTPCILQAHTDSTQAPLTEHVELQLRAWGESKVGRIAAFQNLIRCFCDASNGANCYKRKEAGR